jgi:hypothetical protein
LQRLPGITVNRLQSNDDSTHPAVSRRCAPNSTAVIRFQPTRAVG